MSTSISPNGDAFSTVPLPVSITATVVFAIVGCYHVFLFIQHKTWFLWLILMAVFLETAAFGVRAYFDSHPQETRKFLISYLLVNLAPSILSVALMYTFSRLTWYTTPPFKRKFITTGLPSSIPKKLFKLAYLGSFLIVFLGAGSLVTSPSPSDSDSTTTQQETLSHHLLKAGFIIQTTLTGLFALSVFYYMLMSRKWPAPSTHAVLTSSVPSKPWRPFGWTLSVSATLLTLRTVYRTFECSTPTSTSSQTFFHAHEWLFWPCDVIPVLIVFIALVIFHPGTSLPREYTVFWFRKGKVRKLEKKMVGSQTWPENGWVQTDHGQPQVTAFARAGDLEMQLQQQQQQQKSEQRVYMMEAHAQPQAQAEAQAQAPKPWFAIQNLNSDNNNNNNNNESNNNNYIPTSTNPPFKIPQGHNASQPRVYIQEPRPGSGQDLPLRRYQDQHIASLEQEGQR